VSGRNCFGKLRAKIDADPERRARMDEKRRAYDVHFNLSELCRERGMTQAELAETLASRRSRAWRSPPPGGASPSARCSSLRSLDTSRLSAAAWSSSQASPRGRSPYLWEEFRLHRMLRTHKPGQSPGGSPSAGAEVGRPCPKEARIDAESAATLFPFLVVWS